MQPFPLLRFEFFQRLEADLEMLADPPTVEFAGHSGSFISPCGRFVRDAEQLRYGTR